MRESAAASHIRLEAARDNVTLWRNNVGVLLDINGRPVRYGLCNDSKKMNEKVKSSDLVGITPIVVTQEMVGQVIGVFTAVETKAAGWVYRESDKRAVAQQAFINIVLQNGGFAGFANDINTYKRIIKR